MITQDSVCIISYKICKVALVLRVPLSLLQLS